MSDLQKVAQLMLFGSLALSFIVVLSPWRGRKIAWFLLGVYGVITTMMIAATVEFSKLDAFGKAGYISAPVGACLYFAVAVWRARE